jgi:hypothetical protein
MLAIRSAERCAPSGWPKKEEPVQVENLEVRSYVSIGTSENPCARCG